MKKLYFLLLIVIFLSIPVVFGQEAGTALDSSGIESPAANMDQIDAAQSAAVPLSDAQSDVQAPNATPVSPESAADTASVTTAEIGAAHGRDAVKAEDKDVLRSQVETGAQAESVKPSASGSITKVEAETIETDVEMNEPTQRTKRRAFSMHTGLSIETCAATNAVSLTDFLKKEMVIDLPALAKRTIRTGIHAGNTAEVGLFWQFTVLEEHTVRFSTMVNQDFWLNIPKSLLELAANGNAANAQGKPIEGDFNAKLNAFVDTGILYQMKKPKYSISARLAYFLPVAYMENPKIHYSIKPAVNDKTGQTDGLVFEAKGTAQVYSSIASGAYNDNFPSLPDILKAGGLDLSLSGSYRLANWVNLTGGIDYLPLMVVTTNEGIQAKFEMSGKMNTILDNINGELLSWSKPFDYSLSSKDLPKKKIMRPGKIRIGADFHPFGNNYLILSPFIAFPFINAKPYYADGGLKLESRFAKVLGASLSTACIERIWRHELALFLDSRFFSLTFAASAASQSFTRTFYTLSGLGFRFAVGIGF